MDKSITITEAEQFLIEKFNEDQDAFCENLKTVLTETQYREFQDQVLGKE